MRARGFRLRPLVSARLRHEYGDVLGVGGQRSKVFDVVGQDHSARLCHRDDYSVDGRTSSGARPQRASPTGQPLIGSINDPALLEEAVDDRIGVRTSRQAFDENHGGHSRRQGLYVAGLADLCGRLAVPKREARHGAGVEDQGAHSP